MKIKDPHGKEGRYTLTSDLLCCLSSVTSRSFIYPSNLLPFFQDYKTNGQIKPDIDAKQDWKLTYSSENDGITKFQFYRKLNTNDEMDVVIQVISGILLIHPRQKLAFHHYDVKYFVTY